MIQFAEGLKARGVLKASEALSTDAGGARVAIRGGKRVIIDGPFAESREIVGGFFLLDFLLDCQTKEEAVTIAAECPAAEWATIEVREVGPCWTGAD